MSDNVFNLSDHKAEKERRELREAEKENTKIIWPEDVTKEQIQAANKLIDSVLDK